MSTSETIMLQATDSREDGNHTATHTGSLEPDDIYTTTDGTQETSSRSKQAAAATPRSRWMKIFTTVAALTGYMFLNAGTSMIALFYPIVVSQIKNKVKRGYLRSRTLRFVQEVSTCVLGKASKSPRTSHAVMFLTHSQWLVTRGGCVI